MFGPTIILPVADRFLRKIRIIVTLTKRRNLPCWTGMEEGQRKKIWHLSTLLTILEGFITRGVRDSIYGLLEIWRIFTIF